jgi:two-component system nitrate/nitrite response regulator NarL
MAIVDIDLPSIDGFQLLRRLKQRSPDLRSLLIAARPHGALVYEAIAEGVTGLVAKSAGVSELQTAAAEVAAGKVFIWPPLQADLATYVQARESRRADALTARERDVLREVAGGFSTREIAERVCLSEPTVKTHLSRAFVKLEVSDRTAAVVEALRRGIIDLGVGDRRRRQRQPRLSSLLPATTEAFESGARPEPGSPLRENPQFLDE